MANTCFQEKKKNLLHVSQAPWEQLQCQNARPILPALLQNGRHWKWAKFGQYLL